MTGLRATRIPAVQYFGPARLKLNEILRKGTNMEKKKGFSTGALVTKAFLAVAIILISLSLAGCGEQMARLEENQLKLQSLVEANAQQISAVVSRIEQNQIDLQAALENVRNTTQQLGSDITVATSEHTKLQKNVLDDNKQMTGRMAMMEQKQQTLRSGIEDVQSGTMKVADDIATVVETQLKLEGVVQSDRQQMSGRIAAIEQNQTKHQSDIESLRSSVRKVAAGVLALEENLSKLQELLKNDTRDLAGIIEAIGQGQLEFEQKIQKDVRTLADSIGAVEQNQDKLQKQIEEVQSNTQAMIDKIMTALKKLEVLPAASAKPDKAAKSDTTTPKD